MTVCVTTSTWSMSQVRSLFCQQEVILLHRPFHPASQTGFSQRFVQWHLRCLVVISHSLCLGVDCRELLTRVELVPSLCKETKHFRLAQHWRLTVLLFAGRCAHYLHAFRVHLPTHCIRRSLAWQACLRLTDWTQHWLIQTVADRQRVGLQFDALKHCTCHVNSMVQTADDNAWPVDRLHQQTQQRSCIHHRQHDSSSYTTQFSNIWKAAASPYQL